jgi:hypothetical protein
MKYFAPTGLVVFGMLIAQVHAQSAFEATEEIHQIEFDRPMFKVGDRVSAELTASPATLQRITRDLSKLVLYIDGIALRGLATNSVLATNRVKLTNSWFGPRTTLFTNYVPTNWSTILTNGQKLSFRFSSATNATVSSRPETTTNYLILTNLAVLKVDFVLDRNENNRREWTALLGSPKSKSKEVTLGIGLEITTPAVFLGMTTQKPHLIILPNEPFVPRKSPAWIAALVLTVICVGGLGLIFSLSRKPGDLLKHWSWLAWIGILLGLYVCFGATICWIGFAVLFLAGFIYLAKHTGMLRDSGPPPPTNKLRPYSLARTQMAVWFFLAVVSFVFIWLITKSLDTITSTVLALMGIGAGTALGAEAQDAGKVNKLREERDVLLRKNLLTDDEKCRLRTLERLTMDVECLEREAAQLKAQIARLTAVGANADQLRASTERFQRIDEILSSRPVSANFLADILTDDVGISFHRFQMFVWTIVLAVIFVASVYESLAMPEFNATLLALMGISSGTYLGFMIAERKT